MVKSAKEEKVKSAKDATEKSAKDATEKSEKEPKELKICSEKSEKEKSDKPASEKSGAYKPASEKEPKCAPKCPATIGPLDDRLYIIASPAISFAIPDFSANFASCPLDYTFALSSTDGTPIHDFPPMTFDFATNTFRVYWTDNLSYVADVEEGTDYVINVVGTNGSTLQLETAFILTLKSPCFDIDQLEFPEHVELPTFRQYRLGDFAAADPQGLRVDTESMLSVVTPLCKQGLSYEVMFNGLPLTYTSYPAKLLLINDSEINVALYTSEIDYLGYNALTVRAILPHIDTSRYLNRRLEAKDDLRRLVFSSDPFQIDFSYLPSHIEPQNPYRNTPFAAMSVIEIIENCDLIRSLTSEPIDDITITYDNVLVVMPMQFVLDPSICPLVFTCTNGSGPDESGDFCNFVTPNILHSILVDVSTIDPVLYPPGDY